jgi:hypothetical protein
MTSTIVGELRAAAVILRDNPGTAGTFTSEDLDTAAASYERVALSRNLLPADPVRAAALDVARRLLGASHRSPR